jgi:hypothetical protein
MELELLMRQSSHRILPSGLMLTMLPVILVQVPLSHDLSGNGYTNTLTGATYTVLSGVKCFDCTTGTSRVVVNGTGPTLPTSGYTYITWARLEAGNPASFRTLLYTNSPKIHANHHTQWNKYIGIIGTLNLGVRDTILLLRLASGFNMLWLAIIHLKHFT